MNKFTTKKIPTGILFLAFVSFMYAGLSVAQDGPRLDLKTTVEKEVMVNKDGEWVTKRIPAGETGPGDILVFTIEYLNTGTTDAIDAAIVNPIPQGSVYILDSAGGEEAEVMCSIDNGNSWHKPPVMVRVKDAQGKEKFKPAPAERYTHIRWIIKQPVPPGYSGRVGFKVTVK